MKRKGNNIKIKDIYQLLTLGNKKAGDIKFKSQLIDEIIWEETDKLKIQALLDLTTQEGHFLFPKSETVFYNENIIINIGGIYLESEDKTDKHNLYKIDVYYFEIHEESKADYNIYSYDVNPIKKYSRYNFEITENFTEYFVEISDRLGLEYVLYYTVKLEFITNKKVDYIFEDDYLNHIGLVWSDYVKNQYEKNLI